MTTPAGERLGRVLAIVPWIVANPGVEIATVADRFGITEKQLLADLDVVFMVGLPPYSPDELVDVLIDDGRVWINFADFFSRPLRLTSLQSVALVAASDALLSMPGTEPDGPLARALGKLAATLGLGDDASVEVDLGTADPEHLHVLRTAVAEGTEVEIDYYSEGRDDHTKRVIAPVQVFASDGRWYVDAWCHQAGAQRLFRLDRISRADPTGTKASYSGTIDPAQTVAFHPSDDDPRVRVRLEPSARWVVDSYPVEDVAEGPNGTVDVTLAITTETWLTRLELVLGTSMVVIDDSQMPGAGTLGVAAAERILARYSD